MLIKAVTKKGDAIPYTPDEALVFAVDRGVTTQNTLERVYWVRRDTVKKTAGHSNLVNTQGDWEATAEGTALVGYTDAKTDHFHMARPYKFSVHYKTKKDDLGLPDIGVVSFKLDPLSNNPRDGMSFQELPQTLHP